MKKIYDGIITALLVIMIMLIAVMFVPKIFKISPYVVVSESMEPTYSKGDLIYVKNDTSDIKNGDVITFYTDKDTIVTHRVTEINVSDHTYTTKGDANQTDDPRPVSMGNVIGRPVFSVPKLGILADALSGRTGKIMYAGIIIILLLLLFSDHLFLIYYYFRSKSHFWYFYTIPFLSPIIWTFSRFLSFHPCMAEGQLEYLRFHLHSGCSQGMRSAF